MDTKYKFIIGGVIVVALAFYGGVRYSEAKTTPVTRGGSATAGQFAGAAGFAGRGGAGGAGGMRGGATFGNILSKDANSITVSLQAGGSRIVFLTSSTTVSKTTTGTKDDLVVGQGVLVTGAANSDGSVNANSIELRALPMAR